MAKAHWVTLSGMLSSNNKNNKNNFCVNSGNCYFLQCKHKKYMLINSNYTPIRYCSSFSRELLHLDCSNSVSVTCQEAHPQKSWRLFTLIYDQYNTAILKEYEGMKPKAKISCLPSVSMSNQSSLSSLSSWLGRDSISSCKGSMCCWDMGTW